MSYIDDLLGLRMTLRLRKVDTICKLLKDLNIPNSEAKLTPPTTRIVCLDIEIDSVTACMSIPQGKLEEILQTCQSFSKLSYVSKRQLQSVIGSHSQSCQTCQVFH